MSDTVEERVISVDEAINAHHKMSIKIALKDGGAIQEAAIVATFLLDNEEHEAFLDHMKMAKCLARGEDIQSVPYLEKVHKRLHEMEG